MKNRLTLGVVFCVLFITTTTYAQVQGAWAYTSGNMPYGFFDQVHASNSLFSSVFGVANAGTLNAQIVEPDGCFGAPQAVSPRTLSTSDKVRRWQEIWFPNVSVRS